jgi:hypothetical protein
VIDAMQVIEMRLRLIAGGKGTPEEMFLMVNEKIDALTQASTILARGGNCTVHIERRPSQLPAPTNFDPAQSCSRWRDPHASGFFFSLMSPGIFLAWRHRSIGQRVWLRAGRSSSIKPILAPGSAF